MQKNVHDNLIDSRESGIAFAMLMILYIIVSFLGQSLCAVVFGLGSVPYIAVCSCFSVLSITAVIAYFVFYKKNKFVELVSIKPCKFIYFPLAIVLAVGMFMGLGFVNESLAGVFTGWGLTVSGISLPLDNVGQFILFSFLYALLPAVFEELFFRGLLVEGLKSLGKVYSVLLSALCFALYHCSAVQFVYQFIYGVALGFLSVSAKSIVPCIVAHFINNFAVISFEFFKIAIDLYSIVVIILGAMLLVLFTVFLCLIEKVKKTERVKGNMGKFFLPFGTFGIVLCLVLLVGNLVA